MQTRLSSRACAVHGPPLVLLKLDGLFIPARCPLANRGDSRFLVVKWLSNRTHDHACFLAISSQQYLAF
jgi:hypothetical protein